MWKLIQGVININAGVSGSSYEGSETWRGMNSISAELHQK